MVVCPTDCTYAVLCESWLSKLLPLERRSFFPFYSSSDRLLDFGGSKRHKSLVYTALITSRMIRSKGAEKSTKVKSHLLILSHQVSLLPHLYANYTTTSLAHSDEWPGVFCVHYHTLSLTRPTRHSYNLCESWTASHPPKLM